MNESFTDAPALSDGCPASRRLLQGLVFFLFGLCAVLMACNVSTPFDIWWQLANGRLMAVTGKLVSTDVFSFTVAGQPYLDKYWLFERLVYGLYALGGWTALEGLRIALVLACGVCLLITYRRAPHWALLLVLLPVLILLELRCSLRGFWLSFILLPILLRCAEQLLGRAGQWRPAWLGGLLLTQWIWTNLHSEFLWGYLVVGIYALEYTLMPRGEHAACSKRLGFGILTVAGALLVSLLNPFGWHLPAGLVREALVVGSSTSAEWLPLVRFAQPLTWAAWAGLVLLAGFSFWAARSRFSPARLLLVLLFAGFSLKALRFLGPFALVSGFVIMENLHSVMREQRSPVWGRAVSVFTALVLLVLIWGITTDRLFHWQGEKKRFGSGIITSELPVDAVAFAKQHGLTGNLINDWSYGGYMIWNLHPDVKVAEDGRTAPFGKALNEQLASILKGNTAALAEFEKQHRVDGALLAWYHGKLMAPLMQDPGWDVVFVGAHGTVWMKRTALEEQGKLDLVLKQEQLDQLVLRDVQAAAADESWLNFQTFMFRRAIVLWSLNRPDLFQQQVAVFKKYDPHHPLMGQLEQIMAMLPPNKWRLGKISSSLGFKIVPAVCACGRIPFKINVLQI